MNKIKRICSIFMLVAIIVSAFSFSPNTIKAHAEETINLTVIPGGISYNGKSYTENTSIDVASGSTVLIGYYAMNSGWMVFGLPYLESSGSGVDTVYKAQLQGNYKVTVDVTNHIVYFRKTYVGGAHTHNMVWGQITMPTYYRPSFDTYFCPECYYVESTRPATIDTYNSMYHPSAPVTNIQTAIANAQPGGSITVNLGKINNISASDMNAIKASNLTITLNYDYNGKNYQVTIPAGRCVTNSSIEFYGPELVNAIYNGQ